MCCRAAVVSCCARSWLLSDSLPLLSSRLWSWRAFAAYTGWLLLHTLLYRLVPGGRAQGVPLDERGNRLSYPTNGQRSAAQRSAAPSSSRRYSVADDVHPDGQR